MGIRSCPGHFRLWAGRLAARGDFSEPKHSARGGILGMGHCWAGNALFSAFVPELGWRERKAARGGLESRPCGWRRGVACALTSGDGYAVRPSVFWGDFERRGVCGFRLWLFALDRVLDFRFHGTCFQVLR